MRGYICWFFCFVIECQFLGFTNSLFSSSSPFIQLSSRTGIIVINICTYISSTTTHFRTKNHTRNTQHFVISR
ncbi:hypothetical protein CI102_11803 [Trichoderma harzianum]|nr:hypothetical protein CI102_11803 [Trichoderma harzianum]